MKNLVGFLLFMFSSYAVAKDGELANSSITGAGGLAKWAGSTIFILAFIFLIVYILKKTKLVRSSSKNMQILGQLSLGPKERIMHVNVNGQNLLLGVTPNNINLICHLDPYDFKHELNVVSTDKNYDLSKASSTVKKE